MTDRERVLSRVSGKGNAEGSAPVASILSSVTYEMMESAGVSWPEAHMDARKMVRLASRAVEMCGWASLKLPFDMMVEAEAIGAETDYGDRGTLPQARGHLFALGGEFNPPDDFLQRGRAPLIREVVKIARDSYPDHAVVASVVGPFALAGKLFGTDDVLSAALLEPELLERTLSEVTQRVVEYADSLAKSGADIILMGDPTSSNDLISPKIYERFVMRCHSRVAKGVSAPVIVHICGDIRKNLPFIGETGLAGLSIDYESAENGAHMQLKGKLALAGWVDPLAVLLRGTPESVYMASMECLKGGCDILTPGCALSPATPLENLLAMTRAARDFAD